MYVHREGVSTIKQKLDIRNQITAPEYIDAFLSLLGDNRAYDYRDFNDMMFHLRKVSRDALERPWHAVRRWSNFVWDAIEAGDISWADRDIIQDERVRLCLTCPTSVQNAGQLNNRSAQVSHSANQEQLCRAFNSRNGCHHKQSHTEGSVLLAHHCSYCDSVGKACGHSVRDCERRITHARATDHPYYQRRGSHQAFQYTNNMNNQAFPQNQMFHAPQQYQGPKNGY